MDGGQVLNFKSEAELARTAVFTVNRGYFCIDRVKGIAYTSSGLDEELDKIRIIQPGLHLSEKRQVEVRFR
jgi:hypothetical protein